jgi:cardiolipin synthase
MDPRLYGAGLGSMTVGNLVSLLLDGRQAYPAMLQSIAAARRTIHFETYLFRADRVGQRFADALAAAARRGVCVRVIYDALGCLTLRAGFERRLRRAGVQLVCYHPLRHPRLPWTFRLRDHRKILVVDATTAFVGGLNIGEEYAPPEEGGRGWRDNHARVVGPAASELDSAFLRLWREQTGEQARRPRRLRSAARAGSALARVLVNRTRAWRHRIANAMRRAVRRASRSIDVSNCYFLPDLWTRRALRHAARRGVRVRVLVPWRSDVEIVRYAGRRLFDELLSSGVRIFEYQDAVLHAKSLVVDGVWSAIGSYNMDPVSFHHNLEVSLNVVDPEFGAQLERSFEMDLQCSREIRLEEWRRRPLWSRLFERAAFQLRYWL